MMVVHAAVAMAGVAMMASADSEWKVLPCYGGGYVQNVMIAPSAPNVWYAYVDVGGPYRSDDAGRHWRPLHGNLAAAYRANGSDQIRSLSIDPRNADSFVMCGGGNFANPGGIFVSRDGGRSFRKAYNGRFYGNGRKRAYGLALGRNPFNPDELVAGEDWDGVALSTDNGETWRTTGLENTWLADLRYDRTVKGRVYACACSPNHPRKAGEPDALEYDGRKYETGFFRSDDGGRSWEKLGDASPGEVCQIANRSELIGYFDHDRVKRSVDGGRTWNDYHEGLPGPDTNKYWAAAQGNFLAFGAGSDFYLAGDAAGGIWRRKPGDAQWTPVTCESKRAGVPEREPRLQYMTQHPMDALSSLIVNPKDDDHWLATDWYEIWESTDAGRHWTSRVDGIMQLVSFTIEFDPFSEKNIIYGVADMGLFTSVDGGNRYWAPNGWVYACTASYSHKTPGLAMMCGGKGPSMVKRSKYAGRWWEDPALRGLPKLDGSLGAVKAYTIANNPADDSFLILVSGPVEPGKGGIYRTKNAGDDWEWFGEGLPRGKSLFKEAEWVDGVFPQLYFGPDGSAVCHSKKLWKNWCLDRKDNVWRETNKPVGLVAADPFTPGRFLAFGKPIQESLDGGATFHPFVDSNLGECAFLSFDWHTKDLVVAGIAADRTVAVSWDGGRHWAPLAGSDKVPSGCSSKVIVDRKRLFYLTTGSGVFTRTLPDPETKGF
ncbi:MAG: hypothetical protein ACOX9C_11820 [Kiritimatiellia bacterium]|jgi:photosystem II stability/assembly factor-like uncharacterized protein